MGLPGMPSPTPQKKKEKKTVNEVQYLRRSHVPTQGLSTRSISPTRTLKIPLKTLNCGREKIDSIGPGKGEKRVSSQVTLG